jgi:UDP-N-acetylmuramoylalanine--D-glutamate ligase
VDGRTVLGRPAAAARGFLEDVAAAAAAGLAFGLPPDAVAGVVASARPGAHRGEVVAWLDAVPFVDDSKATNPHAALAALEGRSRVVLIAGGRAKGIDLAPLTEAADRMAGVVVMGEAGHRLVALFEGLVPLRRAASIEDAVHAAAEMVPADGTVLLAPACASTDMFRDYAERGDRFAAAARRLVRDRTGRVGSTATGGEG